MKLTVLVDNNTLIDRYFLAEPAVSFFIEAEDKIVLFDVGYSDVFIKNAQKMSINLLRLDYIALSHGHLDHTWGLIPLIRLYSEAAIENIRNSKPTIVAHPAVLKTRTVGNIAEIGSVISEDKLSRHFKLNLRKEPIWLTDRLVFLGQIPRKYKFEANTSIGTTIEPEGTKDDYVIDDSALAYISSKGLVIITGCAHSGICNTIEHAKETCKIDKVVDVIGGFHLLRPTNERLHGTLEYIKSLKPAKLHSCHCTDLKSKISLSDIANLEEVGVGLRLKYE